MAGRDCRSPHRRICLRLRLRLPTGRNQKFVDAFHTCKSVNESCHSKSIVASVPELGSSADSCRLGGSKFNRWRRAEPHGALFCAGNGHLRSEFGTADRAARTSGKHRRLVGQTDKSISGEPAVPAPPPAAKPSNPPPAASRVIRRQRPSRVRRRLPPGPRVNRRKQRLATAAAASSALGRAGPPVCLERMIQDLMRTERSRTPAARVLGPAITDYTITSGRSSASADLTSYRRTASSS